jgi:hypothetical protein
VKPPGPPDKAAQTLARSEADRLGRGDLWFVDDDLCALLNAAHHSMPVFAPRPEDLLSKTGFVVFAEPIAAYPGALSRDDSLPERLGSLGAAGDAEFRALMDRIHDREVAIIAVSWGPVANPFWRSGGLAMSFYVQAAVHEEGVFTDPAAARRVRAMLPRLVVDDEVAFAWRPPGAPVDESMNKPAPGRNGVTGGLFVVTGATIGIRHSKTTGLSGLLRTSRDPQASLCCPARRSRCSACPPSRRTTSRTQSQLN